MIANKAKRNKITQLETKLRAAEGQIENLKQEEAKYSTQNKNLLVSNFRYFNMCSLQAYSQSI